MESALGQRDQVSVIEEAGQQIPVQIPETDRKEYRLK